MPFHLREEYFKAAESLGEIFQATFPAMRDQLAFAGFSGGREHFKQEKARNAGTPLKPGKWVYLPEGNGTLAEAMGFLPWLSDLRDLGGPTLTGDAAEEIEDELMFQRRRLLDAYSSREQEIAQQLKQLSASAYEGPYFCLLAAAGLLERNEGGLPHAVGEKVITFALFCGSIP